MKNNKFRDLHEGEFHTLKFAADLHMPDTDTWERKLRPGEVVLCLEARNDSSKHAAVLTRFGVRWLWSSIANEEFTF